MIAEDRCVGIKTMVSAQGWAIDSHAGRDLFAFLEETGVAGLFHSYSEWEKPADFAKLAKDFPKARFIVAHAGVSAVLVSHLLGLEMVPWAWLRFCVAWSGISRMRSISIKCSMMGCAPTKNLARDESFLNPF